MSRFVLRYSRRLKMEGYIPISEDEEACYLYKNVSRDRQGYLLWRITKDPTHARSWATREGAEGYLLKNLTFSSGTSWDVEESA